MNKRMRKANKMLLDAYEFCKYVTKQDAKKTTKPLTLPKSTPSTTENLKTEARSKISIVKMQKGDFRVEVDGKIIDKRFKSVTAAQEWCAVHVR